MYKVIYYAENSASYNSVVSKWFDTADEAFDFCKKLGDRVIETKQYANGPEIPKNYPPAELDFS
jgi:hypothetical protein